MDSPQDIARRIAQDLPDTHGRRLIALAGPPAAGKSTIAEALVDHLNRSGMPTGLLAMDGFHLDNPILDALNLRPRKGAPDTFDVAGFKATVERVKSGAEVIAPRFDRALDVSVGAAVILGPDLETIVVEGNYLLLDAPGWSALHALWDHSVMLSCSLEVLEARLIKRWLNHGLDADAARDRARGNDLTNAHTVLNNSIPADTIVPL